MCNNILDYVTEKRANIALAVLAVLEAGLFLHSIMSHHVWFTYDGRIGTICIQCFDNYWVVTWDFCGEQPTLKTYEELLQKLKTEQKEFEERNKYYEKRNQK